MYGDIYVVNLVNQKGYEKPVKEAFERALQEVGNPKVHYTYFDFHHETKGLRFDRVAKLIDNFEDDLNQQGFFYASATPEGSRVQRTQTSAVRSNCMDSLDRTNVVQSTFAKRALTVQLRQAGVLGANETLDNHGDFMFLFRNSMYRLASKRFPCAELMQFLYAVWADNADTVSKAYSGTGALKTDYTRTGKRTNAGLIQDGVNSIMRYVKNNFLDGPRQDAYDLVTGTWIPRKGDSAAFIDHRPVLTRIVPYVLFASLATMTAIFNFPRLSARKRFRLSI